MQHTRDGDRTLGSFFPAPSSDAAAAQLLSPLFWPRSEMALEGADRHLPTSEPLSPRRERAVSLGLVSAALLIKRDLVPCLSPTATPGLGPPTLRRVAKGCSFFLA